ncbi:MAG: hypothetical protein KDA32_06155, partial [Phycisphaerales bacterium]|nr:hypothetical protein [Phycisphaerales bacterium]
MNATDTSSVLAGDARAVTPITPRADQRATLATGLLADGPNPAEFFRLLDDSERVTPFSYAQLLARGVDYAGAFAAGRCTPGDHVVILHGHSIDLYAAFVGAVLAGLVPTIGTFSSPKLAPGEW